MRFAGPSSWRLDIKSSDLAELALFVREAAELDVKGLDWEVPPLLTSVPDLTDVLDASARRDTADQWQRWWGQILELEFQDWQDERSAAHARTQRRAEHEAVCDPPTFQALGDRPGLQTAVRASFTTFTHWAHAPASPEHDAVEGSLLEWSMAKQIAEDVGFDRRVDLGAVQATVTILRVQGLWWRRMSAGWVWCSTGAATDPVTARVLLRDAFDSHVSGPA